MKRFLVACFLVFPMLAQAGERPVLTTAGVVMVCPSQKIALIERGKAPFGYAMFGGHVEYEKPEQAFKREANEELSISDISNMRLLGVHGNPGRDPRQHSVEVTYACTTKDTPVAASDAKTVHLLDVHEVEALIKAQEFAFDHGAILENYLRELGECNPCEQECSVGLSVDTVQ